MIMRATLLLLTGIGVMALASGPIACAATGAPNEFDEGEGGDGGESDTGGDATNNSGNGGAGGADVDITSGAGGSTSSGPLPTELVCPVVAQEILILDFRSGWWSGGGGGNYGPIPLQAMANVCDSITVEYHHFEVSFRVKCQYSTSGGPGCQEIQEEPPATTSEILALFGKPNWDDYTQVWILSGSELDATDVSLTGALFDHFLGQTKGSCIPVLIGAGDGFITHGNAVASELGLGQVFSTEFVQPGFFSVALDPNITVNSRMYAGAELKPHLLFQDVDSIADTVSTFMQSTHGETIADQPGTYDIIAHDSSGRAAIAVGDIDLPGGDYRPFILDAGFQRYYSLGATEGTQKLLENFVKYLGSVGCKADPPK
jgi:hypothetical protein